MSSVPTNHFLSSLSLDETSPSRTLPTPVAAARCPPLGTRETRELEEGVAILDILEDAGKAKPPKNKK